MKGNVVEPNTHKEISELWNYCVESSKRENGKINWKFVEMEMFGG